MARGNVNTSTTAASIVSGPEKPRGNDTLTQSKPNRELVTEESFESLESSRTADNESKQLPTNSRIPSRMNTHQPRSLTKSPLLLRRPSKSNNDDAGRADLSRSVDSLTKRAEYQQTSMSIEVSELAR